MTARTLKFAIFGNTYQAKKSVAVENIIRCLNNYGAYISIDSEYYHFLVEEYKIKLDVNRVFRDNDFDADFVISMGGDGTFLKAVSRVGDKSIPIIGEVCDAPGEYASLGGDIKAVQHVEFVDQNPIGKSTRSNPATYVKAYDAIRDLFADQPLSRQMGFTAQYFSFNTNGGRCDECKGAGVITVEMQFMADLVLECEHCHGKRFKSDILEVRFHGKNIADVLDMTIDDAIEFFTQWEQHDIVKRLQPLQDVGLGYIRLGQSSSTLSGGENQRVKLAYFIGQEKIVPTMFIFDEPTTGLHFHDIKKLLESFNALISRGHTIVIIEHNLDVIKCADHIIDIGPDGGERGGNIVAVGTPEEVSRCNEGFTAKYLREKLLSCTDIGRHI